MRKNISKNNKKRLICTVIVGAMLCAGAAFGVTKYVNRDTTSKDGTDTSIVNTQGQSGDVTKADQTVYMTDFQKENAQKEAEIVADKVEDKKDTLTADQGLYAPDSIVLTDTTKEEAERIADKLGAEVRLTDDESFAVLYLPEGMTIDDVYNNDEYSQEITEMTPDYYVSVSALNQKLALNLAGDKSKSETTTYSDDSQIDDSLPVSKVTKARPDYAANDPDFSNQQYLDYINLKNTWNTTKGSGVTVAVIDSGIDTDHPEFAGRISEKSYNASEDKIVKDYDISVIEDEQGHGTEVAGVLAASMDNNEGIVGVAPEVELLVIKCNVTASGEFVRGSDAVFGLAYAIEADVDVINMSFGSYEDMYSKYTELAVDSDIICVAAAGNDGSNMPVYPASLDSVISVGAYDTDNETITDYSNYGENVDILAPGTTYTTAIGGGYTIVSGTSMSAPVAAGAAALYRSAFGKTEFTDMKQLFEASSVDIGIAGEDYYHGFGEVDVYALVCEEKGKITYDMMTDEIANQTQIFVKGHTVQTMPEPEREYLVFDGWNFDPNCEDVCEYYTNVFNEDVTLYASWVNEDDGTAFTYVKNSDGTIRITSYTGKRRYVTVPSEIEGGAVTEIGENAFADNRRARSIELPASLQNIRTRAFANCTLIRSIDIPDSVSEIGEEAFVGCVRLSSANISDGSNLRIVGSKAFSQAGISEFNIPASLISLGDRVFYGSTALRKIRVADGNSVYMVKNSALYNADGTSLIYYPSGLAGEYTVDSSTKSIGTAAFAYSRSNEVVLNDGLVSIGEEGFAYSRIGKIEFPESLTSIGKMICMNCTRLESVVFPENGKLEEISSYAFSGTNGLEDVFIPRCISTLNECAFYGSGLNSVEFSDNINLSNIGEYAFAYTDIRKIFIPDSVKHISSGAFFSNGSLVSVMFGDKSMCTDIGNDAFSYTYSLREFSIPDGVTFIGGTVLYNSGITKIEIGANLINIGSGAFASCHNLSYITVDEKNEKYASYDGVLYNNDKTILMLYPAARSGSYTLAETTEMINDYAFSGALKLREVILNEGLTEIGENAFEYCDKLQTPVLPSTLMEIDGYAFMGCSGMMDKLILPKSIRRIGGYAFGWDYALTDIEFEPESVLDRIGYRTFAYCGIEDFTIPGNVSTIAQEAFTGCNKLLTVTFEADSQIENLPAWVFDGADNLRRITFENGSKLKMIEARALEGLVCLENVDFTGCEYLTTIDNYAFKSCKSLGNLTLPETVTEIGRYTFYGCSQMDKMILPETLNSIGRYAFSRTKSINLYFMASVLPADLEDKWDDGIGAYYVGLNKIQENDEWVYAITNEGKASIIKYKGSAESIDIDKIDGYEVSSIGSETFKNNTTLTNITLPDTLTGIYKSAFAGTTALTDVVIPDNVEVIDSDVFAGSGVTSVTFGDNSKLRTIGSGAFANTVRLDEINIPSGVSDVREKLFYNSSLKKVTLPDGITRVGRLAFSGSKLEVIEIPSGVTELGYSAFKDTVALSDVRFADNGKDMLVRDEAFYNTGIEKINIPENISYIGNLCFAKCKNLTDISVAKDNNSYASVDGVFYNKACTKLIACPAGKTGSYTVSDVVMSFATGAFEGSQLSEIIIPNESKLMTIGLRTFYSCKNLTHITIPDSVQSIEYYAFAYCDNLEQVDINADSQLGGIYSGAFYNCDKLVAIIIPDTVQEISDYAFYGCTALKEVTLTENSKLQGVYDHAFEYAGIENFNMPAGMITLGAYAFRGAKLKTFIFNEKLEEIGEYALAESGLTEIETIEIPLSVKEMGRHIFSEVRGIKELTLPLLNESILNMFGLRNGDPEIRLDELEKISILSGEKINTDFAFANTGLRDVYLAESISYIGDGTFSGCINLEKLVIPSQVKEIGMDTFNYCYNLVSVKLPEECVEIGSFAFSGCSSLESIEIPEKCAAIRYEAFYGCWSLKKVFIPKNVKSIGENAFGECLELAMINVDINNTNYKSESGVLYDYSMSEIILVPRKISGTIIIPNGIKKISSGAFQGCRYIEQIQMPNTVTDIGERAFAYCESLRTIELSENLIHIGWWAFYSSGLLNIEIPDSVIDISGCAFERCSKLKSVKMSQKVKKINMGTFIDCSELYDVELGESLEEIGIKSFLGCSSLGCINIPDNVVTVDDSAFESCVNIKNVFIPRKVMEIGEGVFTGCENLKNIVVDEANKYYISVDGILYDWNKTEIIFVPNNISGKVKVPEGIKTIKADAFRSKKYITEISLPDTVQDIGNNAFMDCINLKNIIVGDNIQHIGSDIIAGTKIIEDEGYYENNILYLGKYALNYIQDKGNRLVIKDGTKLISDNCFNSGKFEYVYIPDSVVFIGNKAFYQCENLKNVRWGKGIESIGECAFFGCKKLQNVYLINPDLIINSGAFGEVNSKNVYVESEYGPNYLNFEGGMDVYVGVLDIRYSTGNRDNPKSLILYNEERIKNSAWIDGNIIVYTNVESDNEVLNNFKDKKNEIYCNGQWHLLTYFVDGMLVSIEPLSGEKMIQEPSKKEFLDILPDGASFLGWDINGDGKVDELPATLTSDLEAHAVYSAPITSIVMNTELSVEVDESKELDVTIEPFGYNQSDKITWESADKSIATVADGKVTGVTEGQTTIKAVLDANKDIYAECIVTVTPKTYGIKLTDSETVINVGDTYTLTPEVVVPENDTDKTVFTSGDINIATVDTDGLITGIAPGDTSITISHGLYSVEFAVTVKQPMTSVAINKSETEINVGETITLSVAFEPANTTDDKSVFWYSKDSSIAKVDSDGIVTAVSPGTVDIYGAVGNFRISCSVTVKAPIEKIVLNTTKGTLRLDRTKQLDVIYIPSNTTDNKDVTWSSEDPGIASVDENGLVTGVKTGKTIITGAVGTHTATYTVSVIGLRDDKTGITVTNSDDTEMADGTSLVVDTMSDENIDKLYGDSISDLMVDDNGCIYNLLVYDITLKNGDETVQPDKTVDVDIPLSEESPEEGVGIYRLEADGSTTDMNPENVDGKLSFKTEHFSVYCVAVPTDKYQAAKVEVDKEAVNMCVGNTTTITANVLPEKADDKNLTFVSDDEKIVTVDENGKVTAVSAGKTKITVKSAVDGVQAIVDVSVTEHEWNDGEITTAPTCTETGIKTFTCGTCGEIRTEEIKATGHTVVDDDAVAPTCTKTGLTAGSHCSVCNEVLKAQEEIPALGHTWNEGEITTAPTCTETGIKTFTCETCGDTRTEEVKVTGHTVVDDEAVAPTCTKPGFTEGSHCSVCNEVLQAQEEIPALGHTWNAGEVTTAPTYTTAGVKTFTCEICGETRTESIPKLSRIDISKATSKVKVSGISAKIYNGKSQTQSTLVVTANGKKLKKDTDYSVAYSNNKNIGTATITITGKNGYTGTVRKTFAIKTQVGKVYTTSLKYKVTNARVDGKGTVSVVGSANKSGDRKFTNLKITDTVTIGGVKFKITKIEKNAFRGYKYLSTVTIGSNVTSIGDTAFYGCGKLTTVTVGKRVKTIGTKTFAGCKSLKRVKLLTTQLTKAGKSAFNGIKSNATFALPKKYYNSYSKMIKKAGAPKKAVYKKF